MGKLIVLFILIILSALGVLAYFNQGMVSLTVWQDITFEDIPIIALILISTAVGFFSMFVVTVIRDTKRYIDNWHQQRRQKKEHKIEDNYSRGLNAFYAARYDESIELFTRVITEEPKHANAYLRLGDIAFEKGDLISAKDHYSKAEAVRPRDIEVLLSLEKVFERDRKWQDALKYLNRVLEIDDGNMMVLRKKRDIFEKNKRWEDLIEVQGRILKGDLSESETSREEERLVGYRYELGQQQIEKGETEKAIKTLKSIIKTDVNFVAAYIALAEAYLKDNRVDDAREILEKGYEATFSLVFLVRLEDIFLALGEPGKIIDCYLKAVERNRTDPKIQFFLAKLYFRLEMLDDALTTINNIDTTVFDSTDVHILLGYIHERRSKYEEAAEEYRKALRVERPIVVPFCCSRCGYTSKEWRGRCPECKNWNGLVFDLDGTCKSK
jgi:lipopolysaccharide biosynthesis regulator YciM